MILQVAIMVMWVQWLTLHVVRGRPMVTVNIDETPIVRQSENRHGNMLTSKREAGIFMAGAYWHPGQPWTCYAFGCYYGLSGITISFTTICIDKRYRFEQCGQEQIAQYACWNPLG